MPRSEFRGGQRLADPAGSPDMTPEPLDAPAPSHCRKRYLNYLRRQGRGQRYVSTKCRGFSKLREMISISHPHSDKMNTFLYKGKHIRK